jgi:hypothetical protein
MYGVTEEFKQGKINQDSCEDFIVTAPNVAAVIDGATDKSGKTYAGMTSGKFAAHTIADNLPHLARNVESGTQLISKISDFLQGAITAESGEDFFTLKDTPSVCLVAYLTDLGCIVRVGDCPILINDVSYTGEKIFDRITSLARSAFLEIGFLEQAFSKQEVMQNDPGRAYIMPLLQKQYLAANNADSFLGYGVINGNPVPSKFIDVYPVEKGDTVILASDGYPELKSSLDESEERLQQILKEDPLFQKEFKSTKGLKDNQLSFDDRAYLSIKI